MLETIFIETGQFSCAALKYKFKYDSNQFVILEHSENIGKNFDNLDRHIKRIEELRKFNNRKSVKIKKFKIIREILF